MSHEDRVRSAALTIASLSVFFYGLVTTIAIYYFQQFQKIEKENAGVSLSIYYRNNIGQYDEVKKFFFLILAASSALEIPTYVGCLILDGPTDCEWNEISWVFCWFLHCISLCGYAWCIVMPPVLWSDMINKRDGKLFFSNFPYDNIKRVFRVLIVSYFITLFIDMVLVAVLDHISDPQYFTSLSSYKVCAVIDCVLISLISFACLYCGIRLQIYVRKAKLHRTIEMKFLFSMNVILIMIVLSLLGRAVLVIQFAPFIPTEYQHPTDYVTYTLVSRWLPGVLCQLCLILTMKTPSGKIAKRTLTQSSPTENSRDGPTPLQQQFLDSREDEEGADEEEQLRGEIDHKDISSTNVFSFFSLLNRSSRKTNRSSKSTIKRIDQEYNPFIDSTGLGGGGEKDESFAISAIESHGGVSYRTDSGSESRLPSADMFGNEHLHILTHLTANNDVSDGISSPRENIESSFPNAESYSHGRGVSSIDSSKVVIGEKSGAIFTNPRQFSSDSPMYLSRSVTRGVTDSLDKI